MLFFACAVLGLPALAHAGRGLDASLTVKTSTGTFTGFVNETAPHVNQWLGIPYGAPPVGTKRFMPPEPAEYGGDLDATAYKPICFQQSGNRTGIFWELVPEFQNQDPQSEDCLFLNIWAPRKPVEEKVPVLIWVCGGGLQEGGGHAPYQVPDQWLEASQTHIVITFNYRLNIFGFPGAEWSKNVGMLDTRLAVEWARDNIEAFGGDPKRMVLWGQSAGAHVVDSYPYAHADDPIVSGLIAMSGNSGPTARGPTGDFSRVAARLGCGGDGDGDGLGAAEERACMQRVDARAIQALLESGDDVPKFGSVADNTTVFPSNAERLEKGLVAELPMITGNTVNEAAAFGAGFTLNQTEPPESAFPMPEFGCGIQKNIELRLEHGLTTYRYLFAGNFSNITPRYWLGAMHSSDLPVVFGTHYQFRGNSTELEWLTSFAMQDQWVAFAANASQDPTDRNGLVWLKYGPEGDAMVLFGNATGPAQLVPGNAGGYDCE